MRVMEGSSEYKQVELNGPLICGLPDDIAILCLAKVPRWYHQILRCVSRRWRALLCSEAWLSCRQKNNLQETWIYAMCRDKSRGNCYFVLDPKRRRWKPLYDVPSQCVKKEGMSFEASGNKLYLLGGCSWQKDATDEVYCFDACRNKWDVVPPLPTARCYFASTVLDNKLYVAGGHGMDSLTPKSWDVYDLFSNSSTTEKDPTKFHHAIVKCVALDDKIYTMHMSEDNLRFRAGVYDPLSGTWHELENESARITRCCGRPTVAVGGTLYILEETIGTRLMMWEKESKEWVALGRLSQQLTRPPCQLVAIGRSIFLVGKGLNTMVINLDQVAENARMLVSSSIVPDFNLDATVISCKTITI